MSNILTIFNSEVCLALFVILAGCSGVPSGEPQPQEEPAPVKLVNNASHALSFQVAVIDVGENLTLTWGQNTSDTSTGNISVREGALTYKKGGLQRVRLPEAATVHGRYPLEAGESKLLQIEPVAPDQAIVVLIYDESEGRYWAIHSVSCGGAILGMKVLTQAEGHHETVGVHQCS